MAQRKGTYKYKVGDLVRYMGEKAKITNRFWDGCSTNRYEFKFMIGKNLLEVIWVARESSLIPFERKDKSNV